MKIWCLLSVANNYDQPANNLIGWWVEKPTRQMIREFFGLELRYKNQREFADGVIAGREMRWYETDYRLEELSEGVLKNV